MLKHTVISPVSVALLFLIFIALPMLLYTTYTVNFHTQNDWVEENANQITQDVNKRIAEIETIMASLIGLHYASNELSANEMALFARELRAQADFVTGIGRYEHLVDEYRDVFEIEMATDGREDFQITDITHKGESKARSAQDYYYPISMIEPMLEGNSALLGADLSVVDSLRKNLDKASATNEPVLATFPARWPGSGDLVFFAPVYDGKAAPSAPIERMLNQAGGFWISIDLGAFLASVNPSIKEFDITAKINKVKKSTMLFGQLGKSAQPTYLTSLYLRKFVRERWETANSSVTITLQKDIGFSKAAIVYFMSALLTVLIITALLTVFVLVRRTAVQERNDSQEALFKERERAEKTLNTVQDAIIALDAGLRVVHINPAAAKQFKIAPQDVVGLALDNFIKFRKIGDLYNALNIEIELEKVEPNQSEEYDVTLFENKDSDFVLRLTLTSSNNTDGKLTGHVLVLRDISRERALAKKLAYQANHDALTGCANRHFFENSLTELIDGAASSGETHALCYMDLDQFKVINDTCGHAAGDKLLTDLTENINMVTHDTDVLCRLGGDEFGLLLVNVNEEEVAERSQRVYDFFQNYIFHYDNKAFSVTASIGVVHIDKSSNNLKDVLAWADMSCYAAKDSGRNSLYFYSKEDDAIAERSVELSWLPRLEKAIQEDEFRLVVQAVAGVEALKKGQANAIEHYEFLLRLQNPDGTVSTPWQFIQAAERYDLMIKIDRWVITNAFKTVASLKGGTGEDCSFSINLSGQSAADSTLKTFIKDELERFQVDPSKIWFEVTETAAISHFSVAVDLINNIRSLGSLVALDDFGSGLSSFGYLKNLPVDILKIDGQFVKEIAKNDIDREMVRAIHQVGQSMGIKTVAEFVEDQDIVDVLMEIGVQYAQGYHVGKPCFIEEAIAALEEDYRRAA